MSGSAFKGERFAVDGTTVAVAVAVTAAEGPAEAVLALAAPMKDVRRLLLVRMLLRKAGLGLNAFTAGEDSTEEAAAEAPRCGGPIPAALLLLLLLILAIETGCAQDRGALLLTAATGAETVEVGGRDSFAMEAAMEDRAGSEDSAFKLVLGFMFLSVPASTVASKILCF